MSALSFLLPVAGSVLTPFLAPDPDVSSPQGHSWADVDGDGLADLLTLASDGTPVLLRNDGGGGFENASAMLDVPAGFRVAGAQWIDYDADGRVDLFLWSPAGRPVLLHNEAGADLLDVTVASGVAAEGLTAAQWRDYDVDGRVDLILTTSAGPLVLHALADATFERAPMPRASAANDVAVASSPSAGDMGSLDQGPRGDSTRSTPGVDRTTNGSPVDASGGGRRPLRAPLTGSDPSALVTGNPATPLWPQCAATVDDQAGPGCLSASSNPLLGSLYPISPQLFVSPAGRIGLGTTSPVGAFSVGDYQGGTGVNPLAGYPIQAVLSGVYNTGVNGRGVKLLINDYDNDASADVYPIYAQDENNLTDFYVHKQNLLTSTYMRGVVGIGTTPSTSASLQVVNDGTASRTAIFSTTDPGNTTATMIVTHPSTTAISASTLGTDPAVRAVGTTGIEGVGILGGYGVRGESSDGVAIIAEQTSTSAQLPAMQVRGSGSTLPSLEVSTSASSNPQAASFEGDVHVGVGAFIGVAPKISLEVNSTNDGELIMRDNAGTATVVIDASETTGAMGAQIALHDATGAATITLDADHLGSGRVITEVLQITGGADLVESFDSGGVQLAAGTVVVADLAHPGGLVESTDAYDRTVLGVVSGANGIQPGLHLAQADVLDGDTPVALSGRVYVKASTENGPIRPGDLLTTASLDGHAMRAADPARAFGAVIGKALSALDAETGLVLVLVSLQ